MPVYENNEENLILLGWGLLNDSTICLRRGVKELLPDCPTEDGRHHLQRIQEMAKELDKIEKKYRSSLYDYEQRGGGE